MREVILWATLEIAAASDPHGGVIAPAILMCCREVKLAHAEIHLVESAQPTSMTMLRMYCIIVGEISIRRSNFAQQAVVSNTASLNRWYLLVAVQDLATSEHAMRALGTSWRKSMIRSISSGGSSGWARSVFEHMEVTIEGWGNLDLPGIETGQRGLGKRNTWTSISKTMYSLAS